MDTPVEDFASYLAVDTFAELAGPGSRLLRLPSERLPRAPLVVAGGDPQLRFDDDPLPPIELRCAKVARALCVRRGVVVDMDTGRVLPDIFRRQPPVLPRTADLDLSGLGIDADVDWDSVPVQAKAEAGFYADSWHQGYGHVLLEGLSRCWALGQVGVNSGVVVAHKAARSTYWPWFSALGVDAGRLRSTRKGPLQIDNLLVPSQSYVVDRGTSPRFPELTRRIAQSMGTASGCDRLFVSRRDAPKRQLENEGEIEAMFQAKGFRIFHPEEHTIEEQVRAFAGASLVAGPVGSGLYSVAFSKPSTRLIVLAPDDFFTRNDLILAGARDHAPVFAFGRGAGQGRQRGMFADWYLDPAIASKALEGILADTQ